jgi:oligopeptide/dipeptide ABC transporter ATP-binding protein
MIQTQIINLLKDLRETLNLSMIFINHDLALIAEICDRVAVMYAGRIVEMGTVRDVFFAPAHPYVVQLLRALPRMEGPVDPLSSISGTPPHLREISEGCSFLPRCLEGDAACARKPPPTIQVAPGHLAACIKASTASGEDVRHG